MCNQPQTPRERGEGIQAQHAFIAAFDATVLILNQSTLSNTLTARSHEFETV
jgi:hypothetical protein